MVEAERRAKQAARQRAYLERNREAINARKVAALDANPLARERAREVARQWREKNLDRAKANCRNGNARRRSRLSEAGRLSPDIFSRLMLKQRGRCACCRVRLKDNAHLDHITPLARGGLNVDGNVQLLCRTCNLQKAHRDPVTFMQSRGYLL